MAPFDKIAYFAKHHDTDRWNLQDINDAWTLYYTLRQIEVRYFDLYLAQYRCRNYAKANVTFGEYWMAGKLQNVIFPYQHESHDWGSFLLNVAKRKELELTGRNRE